MSPASAAERAPQQFTSTSNASGWTRATVSARSVTSCTARRPNTATDNFSDATRIGCLPVVQLDPLDPRVDRVGGKSEPLADLDSGGKGAQMNGVAAMGQL